MPPHPPVIKETKKWLVINKPAGLNVEQLWDYPSVEAQVKEYLRRTPQRDPYLGIVHRLDRPVSGVLLLAKKISTLRALNEQFANRQVRKIYWAICTGEINVTSGKLANYLMKDQKNKRAIAYDTPKTGAIPASLAYRVLGKNNGFNLLEVRPLTGKFHQIRVQLAHRGWPIVGDEKYGGLAFSAPNAIALHARALQFTDPEEEASVQISAELPSDSGLWRNWKLSN